MQEMQSPEQQESEDSGSHSIPLARIKSITQTVSDTLSPSPDGLFAFAKACELFIEDLVRNVSNQYGENIDYDEVASFILENDELSYMHDFFPRSMTFAEAVEKVREKNAE